VIVLPRGKHVLDAAWETLILLNRRQPAGWTLIGAQMVALHALEHGRMPPRRSEDVDVLVNVRAVHDGTRRLSRALQEEGFSLEPPNLEGIGHRFRGDRVTVDVLAPEGLGHRADLFTVPPAHTVSVPGGTQALRRTEHVEVRLGRLRGSIPRPNLLGAIVLKACAVGVHDAPDAQRIDLAFLLSLVERPRTLADSLASKDRKWLRRRQELLDPRHPAWFRTANPEIGQRALRVFLAPTT
jgi:hypothetical protein